MRRAWSRFDAELARVFVLTAGALRWLTGASTGSLGTQALDVGFVVWLLNISHYAAAHRGDHFTAGMTMVAFVVGVFLFLSNLRPAAHRLAAMHDEGGLDLNAVPRELVTVWKWAAYMRALTTITVAFTPLTLAGLGPDFGDLGIIIAGIGLHSLLTFGAPRHRSVPRRALDRAAAARPARSRPATAGA